MYSLSPEVLLSEKVSAIENRKYIQSEQCDSSLAFSVAASPPCDIPPSEQCDPPLVWGMIADSSSVGFCATLFASSAGLLSSLSSSSS